MAFFLHLALCPPGYPWISERLTSLCVPTWQFPHPSTGKPLVHSISWWLRIMSQQKEEGRCLFGILILFSLDTYLGLLLLAWWTLHIFFFCNSHITCPINRYSQRRKGVVLKHGSPVVESLCFSNFSFPVKPISPKLVAINSPETPSLSVNTCEISE